MKPSSILFTALLLFAANSWAADKSLKAASLATTVADYNSHRSAADIIRFYGVRYDKYDREYLATVLKPNSSSLPEARVVAEDTVEFLTSPKVKLKIVAGPNGGPQVFLNDYQLTFQGRKSLQSRVEYYARVLAAKSKSATNSIFYSAAYADEPATNITIAVDRVFKEYEANKWWPTPDGIKYFHTLTTETAAAEIEIACAQEIPQPDTGGDAFAVAENTTVDKKKDSIGRHVLVIKKVDGSILEITTTPQTANGYGGNNAKATWDITSRQSQEANAAVSGPIELNPTQLGADLSGSKAEGEVPYLLLGQALVHCCEPAYKKKPNCIEEYRKGVGLSMGDNYKTELMKTRAPTASSAK